MVCCTYTPVANRLIHGVGSQPIHRPFCLFHFNSKTWCKIQFKTAPMWCAVDAREEPNVRLKQTDESTSITVVFCTPRTADKNLELTSFAFGAFLGRLKWVRHLLNGRRNDVVYAKREGKNCSQTNAMSHIFVSYAISKSQIITCISSASSQLNQIGKLLRSTFHSMW